MNTEFSEEQEQLRSEVRRFLGDQASLTTTREHWDDPRGTSDPIWKGLVEMGLVGLLASEAAGGSGGTMADMGVVLQELGRVAYSGPFTPSAVGGVTMATLLGADDLLAPIAEGSLIATVAHAESQHSLSHWSEPETRVQDSHLTGEKIWAGHGEVADVFFVTARDGVYRVDRSAEGVHVEPMDTIDRTRRPARVRFENARCERLGDLSVVESVIDRLVLAEAADSIGAAEICLEQSVAYAKERKQFDQPIGSFQAVAHLCSDMLEAIELSRAGLHFALAAASGDDADEFHLAAVMCKAQLGETLTQVGADAIQIFGGVGFTWEYDLHLYFRRLHGADQMLAGSDEWLEELASLVI
jgi:alkylation response protein AidB-like acyl-CoA dehydrogenase